MLAMRLQSGGAEALTTYSHGNVQSGGRAVLSYMTLICRLFTIVLLL